MEKTFVYNPKLETPREGQERWEMEVIHPTIKRELGSEYIGAKFKKYGCGCYQSRNYPEFCGHYDGNGDLREIKIRCNRPCRGFNFNQKLT